MNYLAYSSPGALMLSKSLRRKLFGFKRYEGDFEDISKQILDSCYVTSKKFNDHKYFNVSAGHFKQFYCRDFGMICKELLELGYKEEVFSTIRYALFIFKSHSKVTSTISRDVPLDFFHPAPDSFPFLMRCIRLAVENGIQKADISPYYSFLQEQIDLYYKTFYDLKKHCIKKDGVFGSSKDHYIRKSSCYDNSAAIGLAIEIRKLNVFLKKKVLSFPITVKDEKEHFLKNYWNESYFFDDLDQKEYVASDANIMPYYWNVIVDPAKKKLSMQAIKDAKLDCFLPVQYTNFRDQEKELSSPEFFAPNYEGTTFWLHIGICYLSVLKDVDKKRFKFNISNVEKMVLKYGNFLEVFSENSNPYSSWAYHCDESMSWIAGYLALMN